MVQTCNAFLSAWLGAVRLGRCWGAAGWLGARNTRALRRRARAVVRRVGAALGCGGEVLPTPNLSAVAAFQGRVVLCGGSTVLAVSGATGGVEIVGCPACKGFGKQAMRCRAAREAFWL